MMWLKLIKVIKVKKGHRWSAKCIQNRQNQNQFYNISVNIACLWRNNIIAKDIHRHSDDQV